ncbi:SDR family oxidoreductase (plasmid) [Deinococcus taeanensis]|uniref:SDR family NAD(P)-dependent oxidoreductase n=1 Tax=Deinococcus taeanensis TaxID=2737050 RepID=UPI001CDBE0BF|nr:SDR family oxidoreductase [Deinococcus taeanensis]UBV44371.1 SDR family oxidoreductase [Deinococcus taeanensis]
MSGPGSELSGQVALVTGGSGGIGSAICEVLAGAGAAVLVGYAGHPERAGALVAALPGGGHRALRVPVDDSAALALAAADVQASEGRLDLLVNNAGVTTPVPHADLDGLSDEWIDTILRVNVRGPFACARAFAPLLRLGGRGVIVNISSVAAVTGLGSNVAYCASKAALDSMTRSLGRALAPDIRVLSVSPGWVDGEYAARMPADLIAAQAARTPLGRIARPQEVARAVLAAAAVLTFSTGAVIPVDGGRPLDRA